MAFPATFVDVQNAVIAKLRLDATADLQRTKDWINQAYAQAAVETQAYVVTGTSVLAAGTASYTLPAAVVRILLLTTTPVSGGAQPSAPLILSSLEEILDRRQAAGGAAAAAGAVTRYALVGQQQLELWPTPAAADTLSWWYAALPPVLSADTDVPVFPEPFASKVLEYGALAEAADFMGVEAVDPARESSYRQLFQDWANRLRLHLDRSRGAQSQQLEVYRDRRFPPHDRSTDLGD